MAKKRRKEIRVLIADDQKPVRQYIRSMLPKTQSVRTAKHCAAVVRNITTRKPPHLVFFDYSLPELDGPAFLDYVRNANGRLRKTKIIILFSQAHSPRAHAEVTRQGADGFLLKPIMRKELRMAVKTVLSGRT